MANKPPPPAPHAIAVAAGRFSLPTEGPAPPSTEGPAPPSTEGPASPNEGLELPRLVCRADVQALLDELASLSGEPPADRGRGASRARTATGRHRFPGPSPVSLERATMARIDPREYWVCEKTDGTRGALMLTHLGGRRVAVLLDRKLAAFLVAPLRSAPTAMFQGSVLDGEVAFDRVDRRWVFLAFDALALSGVAVFHLPLSRRLEAARLALAAYAPDPADALVVRVKRFWPMGRLAEFRAELPATRARFRVDGVVLTPERDGVLAGRHDRLFKLKAFGGRDAHTVDFLSDGAGGLLVYEPSRRVHVAVARVAHEPWPARDAIVECALAADAAADPSADPSASGDRRGRARVTTWRVIGTRADKTTANDALTYRKTVLNAAEALTLDDLPTTVATALGTPPTGGAPSSQVF